MMAHVQQQDDMALLEPKRYSHVHVHAALKLMRSAYMLDAQGRVPRVNSKLPNLVFDLRLLLQGDMRFLRQF